jgi:hypothetical protein
MIDLNSSATENSTCAYGELSLGETVALRTALKKAIEDPKNSFMVLELKRVLVKMQVIEVEADQENRYIGFTVGTERPNFEFNLDD